MDTQHIDMMESQSKLARVFSEKHNEAPGMIIVNDNSITLFISKGDAAKAGKAFGKGGWTRKLNWNGKEFDWEKTVDGVKIQIDNAEENVFIGSPVPEKSFPLEITES